MMPDIYFIIGAAWALMILGFSIKEYILTMLAALMFMVIGVYGIINGIANLDTLVTYAFSVIHIATGFYVLVRGSLEKLEET